MKISLIISTYNWPAALEASLRSAIKQDYHSYEILVADDGSQPDTKALIERLAEISEAPILHIWHEDRGFRLAEIRNRAAARATGDYLIFVDGDCLLPPNFLTQHAWLAEPHCLVAGSRVQLSAALTNDILNQLDNLPDLTRLNLLKLWLQRKIRRIHPIIKWPFHVLRYRRPLRWQGAVGCNIAVWRVDYEAVNGFDNEFLGWGREDSEFIVRLFNYGVTRKDGKLASYVLHLHHRKGSGIVSPDNEARFIRTQQEQRQWADSGVKELSHTESNAQ